MKATKNQNVENTNDVEKTTALDWLEMDLKSQSGAIWTDGKESEDEIESDISILKPDPIEYNNKTIENNPNIID